MHPPFKAVLIGDSSVGKTSICRRIESDAFDQHHLPTIGGAFSRVTLYLSDGTRTEIGLWDTAGQEKFRTIVPMYFQKADLLLAVFDLSNCSSFQGLDGWVELARERAPRGARIVVIGNKADIAERKVGESDAQAKASALDAAGYFEISALNGNGFDGLLENLGQICMGLQAARKPVESTKAGGADIPLTPQGAGQGRESGCC
jgi:small GTP-binding protein